jgi:hypothetical protein
LDAGASGSTIPRRREELMGRDRYGAILLVLGAVVLVLSAFAGQIGIGADDAIGWKQVVGMVVGAVAIVIGGAIWMRARPGEPETTTVDA